MPKSFGQDLSPHDVSRVLKAANYREFIVEIMILRSQKRRFTYAELARRAGFKARSFPRDVVNGKKSITAASLQPFIDGLGLKGDWSEYFRLLATRDLPVCGRSHSCQTNDRKLSTLKARIKRRYDPIKQLDEAFAAFDLPFIYAALGTLDKGASKREIALRSGLSQKEVSQGLEHLMRIGLADAKDDRFYPIANHIALTELMSGSNFHSYFLNSLAKLHSNVSTGFSDQDKLFFNSCFSVAQADLPKLKEDLRTVLHHYIDQNEKPTGNKIATIVCALF